ncbi:MAG: hypothetical protein JNG85_17945, partial [Spirochaetaceae bacterium]|nr:hypothetical protein [Spirochaetaceae bacterium]
MSTKGLARSAFRAAGAAQAAVTALAALRPAPPRALALVVAVGFLALLRYAAIAGLGGTMGRKALLSSACAVAWAASLALLAFALFLAGRR